MKAEQKCWVIIPAYNEAEVIAQVVRPLLEAGYRVVVVDDGSEDPILPRLRGLPVDLCRHVLNLGQGAALQTGIRHALRRGADFIVTFDADGQHRTEDVAALLEPLQAGRCQVTLGSRFLVRGAAPGIPPLRKLLLRSGAWFARTGMRIRVTDMHNGLRGLTSEAARGLRITQNRMAHATQILRQLRRHGFSYEEVPVIVCYTEYSLAKGQKLSNLLNVLWESAAEMFRR